MSASTAPLASPSTVCCPRWVIRSCTTAPKQDAECGRKEPSGRTPKWSSSALRDLLVSNDLATGDLVGPDDRDRGVHVALGVELDVLGHAVLVVRVNGVKDVLLRGRPGIEGVQEEVRRVVALTRGGARGRLGL